MRRLIFLLMLGTARANEPSAIDSIDKLWDGFDPRALPLEVEVIKAWDEGDVHLETIYFTGEIFEGEKTRIFGQIGRPRTAAGKMPGILHIHGGGQSAGLHWPRFWAARGYGCLSFDFCGDTNLPTLGPEYRREHFTKWGKVPADMMKIGGGTQMTPTPRHNPWFHWALAARRGLTLLEAQPDVDADKLGIFGVSVGGTLTWTVAGVDARVKAAAPIYGCGWEFYTYPPQLDVDFGNDLRLWRKLIAPEAHAPRITCPVLLLSASNDGHGRMDLAFQTLDRLASPIRSQVFTANYDHHVEPAEARSLPLWMDTHLKVTRATWPATPQIEFAGGEVPVVRVTPASADDADRVDIYYCLDNDWPTGRFWRTIADVRREGDAFVGSAPFFSPDDKLCAFANVTDKSGVRISSRLAKQPAASIPGARPTLQKQSTIDEWTIRPRGTGCRLRPIPRSNPARSSANGAVRTASAASRSIRKCSRAQARWVSTSAHEKSATRNSAALAARHCSSTVLPIISPRDSRSMSATIHPQIPARNTKLTL
jgi:dienelactone hydrolase